MRKYIIYIAILLLLSLPIQALADGDISISSNSVIVKEGSSQTVTITARNVIGDIDISSDNKEIAVTDINEWGTGIVEENQEVSGTLTITGKKVGSTTITLNYYDVVSFDEEVLSGQEKKITVEVIAKQNDEPVIPPKEEYKDIELTVKDNYGNNLSHAVINILDANNQLIYSDITNENGILTIKKIVYGDYYLVIKEIDDYVVDNEKYSFYVNEDSQKIDIKTNLKSSKVDVPSTGKNSGTIFYIILGIFGIIMGLIISIKIMANYKKKS